MKNLRPSGKKDDDELHEPEGMEVHVSHEHLAKLGFKTPPPVGTDIDLHGEGKVTESHSGEVDGKMRHHIRLTLHKGEMKTEEDPDTRRKGLRDDLENAAEKVKSK